jgi:hypothetical protein
MTNMRGDLKDYVTQERFHVTGVLCKTERTNPEMDSVYRHERHTTEIAVLPYKESCPIRVLHFRGYSTVQTGDSIDARIVRTNGTRLNSEGVRECIPRSDYKKSEIAIEMVRLSADLSTKLRTERSIEYSDHVY